MPLTPALPRSLCSTSASAPSWKLTGAARHPTDPLDRTCCRAAPAPAPSRNQRKDGYVILCAARHCHLEQEAAPHVVLDCQLSADSWPALHQADLPTEVGEKVPLHRVAITAWGDDSDGAG